MIRSRIIPFILAIFCGLAMQFQASGANAQIIYPGDAWGSYFQLNPGWCIYNGPGYHLCMQSDGTADLYDYNNNWLWGTPTPASDDLDFVSPGYLSFQNIGSLAVYDNVVVPGVYEEFLGLTYETNTTAGNSITGNPGVYLVLRYYGNLEMYDAGWNLIWATDTQGE
jgi:hypothetical protein